MEKEIKKIGNKIGKLVKEVVGVKNSFEEVNEIANKDPILSMPVENPWEVYECEHHDCKNVCFYIGVGNNKQIRTVYSKLKEYLATYKGRFNIEVTDLYLSDKDKRKKCNKGLFFAPHIGVFFAPKNKYFIKSPFIADVEKDKLFIDLSDPEDNRKSSKKRIQKMLNMKKMYGFDPTETWTLFHTISMFVLPRLIYFKKHHRGLFWNHKAAPDKYGVHPALSEKKTNQICDKMINAFKIIIKNENAILFDKKTVESSYKNVQEGLKLFAEYFLELWD